jgi:RNA polymerase sigma factor (sigma-70 family)
MINREYNEFCIKFKEKTGYDFDNFYQSHRPKLVWHLTNYFTKDTIKSEDFANEAFIQGLEKIDTYDKEKAQIHTWIYKIEENIVKIDFKERQRLQLSSLDFCLNDDNLSLKKFISYDDGFKELESQILNEKKAEIIEDAIKNLPEKYRHVLVLRELEKKPYLEIAENTRKKYMIQSINEIIMLEYPEELFFINLKNEGNADFRIKIVSKTDDILIDEYISKDNSFIINREEFEKITLVTNIKKIILVSTNTAVKGEYVVTTNLSTIKSQIVKGRNLVKQKVKKKFKVLENNGINLTDYSY